LQKGRVLNLQGEMPVVGYNPKFEFDNVDMVVDVTEFERQIFNDGAHFRRNTDKNAAGDTICIYPWYLENPPVIEDVSPTSATVNSGNVVLTINGTRFGASADNCKAFMRWHPFYNKGASGGQHQNYRYRELTITAISDVQITATVNMNDEWKHSGLHAKSGGQIVVQRTDRKLESDPVTFTLVGG